jgi:hypothetical protein
MFHDILFSQDGNAAYFTMIFSNREAEAGVVEHGAVSSVVEWMFEA